MKNLYLVFFACILLLCGCNGVGEKDTLLARINDEKVYTEDEQILVKMTGGANSTDRSYFLYNRVFSKVALAYRYPHLDDGFPALPCNGTPDVFRRRTAHVL